MKDGRMAVVLLVALGVLAIMAATAGAADDSILKITGTTYTKWLYGTHRNDGSVYTFTTVPGEGYGDNGQGSEIELLLQARVSKQVEVRGRIHSRFNQNQWTNFGGFGGRNPALEDPPAGDCVGGDCGEWDPRSNQYIKLRGVVVTLTPGYSWINSATIGANDFGMFDPFAIGKIRYIDRDNASGLLFQGSAFDRKMYWDATRISLPRLWAGPNFNTGSFTGGDAAYGLQFKMVPSDKIEFGAIYEHVSDIEVQSNDTNLDDGTDVRSRFQNQVVGGKFSAHPDPKIDFSAAAYSSYAKSAPDLAPASFGMVGFSPVIAGRHIDATYKGDLSLNDPFDAGLSFQVQGFDIGANYVSMLAARRESDVLLTEGYDASFAFPGPNNAAFGVFGGNPSRIGYGGWDGTSHQVATINVDNEFTDFDESRAETVIGWRGVTIAPQFGKANFDLSGEFTYIDYSTNWQAWGDDTRSITDTDYPTHELDTGVGHNWRSAYAPFQEKKTTIGVVNAKYTIESGKGVDVFAKVKVIDETDERMNDARYLPYVPGDCPGGVDCGDVASNYYGTNTTSSYFTNPSYITGAGGVDGYQWKPFDDIADDDRDLSYKMFGLGAGYQLTNDFYGSLNGEYYNADLVDGNTALQAYNLHEMASGKHKKMKLIGRGKYVLGGAEIGVEYQANFGTFEPDFGTGFVPQVADAGIASSHNVPVGSLGFSGRYGGWNSLEKRVFQEQRLKAFMKVQF
ncbi:MAG: hypothetical protein AAB011_13235 [Candidatus Eisenbacteria bacterium]